MGCVNKSSKEFKNLAARNNVADNTLELITHKYWIESGNETLFPTDVYIQAQLGNGNYQESGKAVREIWNREYSSPIELTSKEALELAKRRAAKFFPKSVIYSYKNTKGNFILSVKRPVEKADYSKDDFFKEMDSLGSMRDVKTLKLDIKENQSYGIDKVRQLYNKFNTDRTSADLANRVFTLAKDLDITVSFNENLSFGKVGRYINDNTITYKKSFLEKDIMNDKKAPILLHEVLHAVTMYALSDRTKNWAKPKTLQEFKTEMNSLYQNLKTHSFLKGERGIVDVFEFVAELGNPVFRKRIQQIDELNKSKRSLWTRVLDAFKTLLGLHTSNTYYQRSMNALEKALDAFDIDTYMRYNGIKNTLRKGYNEKEWDFRTLSDDELKKEIVHDFNKEVYNEELQALKGKAIANGTFMKAPNGKNSNLSERQWLQVRTKAFKEWFGDWEKEYTPPRQYGLSTWERTGEYVDILKKDFLGNTYSTSNEILSHPVERKETTKEDPFGFNSTGVSKAIKVGTLVNRSNPLNGICQYTAQRVQAFLKDRYGIEAHTNIINAKSPVTGETITHHVAALSIDGKPYIYDMPQTEFISTNGNTFNVGNKEYKEAVITKEYSPRLIEITEDFLLKNYGDPNDTQISVIKDTAKLSGNIKSSDIEANYIPAYSSDVSKVVDENGEPWVVYHYTDNENLTEFSTEFDNFFSKTGGTKNAIFFTTDNVEPGSENNFLTSRKAKLSLFLNIKNLEVFHGTKEDLHKQGTSYREIVNKSSKRKGSENGIVLTGFDDNKKENQTIYVVHNPNQIKSATDNIGTFSKTNNNIADYAKTGEFVNTMSGKELKNELALIEQENADYDLVNNIPEDNKHNGKAVPQDFTFSDGTTIQAPFKPNAQQIDALNTMSDFIKSDETSMTLSGYAGTGKTSLMEMIAKKCRKQHKPVSFCATTNKAAAVLNDRVSKAGFKATTLNKTFGISVEVDTNSKTYNARNLVNNLKDVDIVPGTTIIIDEASMINEENYEILNDIAKKFHLKIIYVGDEAQLAPVNEDKISKVFRNGDGKVIRLTQVERTDDNAILKEATDIRNGKPLSGETSFNSKGEGVAYILPQHQEAISDVINHYVKGLKKDSNYFRILAYTNKAVSDYNNQVRNLLGYDSPTPQAGEPMTGYANWGYDWRTKSYRFINSESYKVRNTGKPTNVKTTLDNGTSIVMEAIPITLEDSMGHVDTFNFMDIKSNPQNRQVAIMLANEKKRLWGEAKRAYGRQAKAEIYQKINALDSFLFINDNIEDDKHNLLQAKTIDFGYAMTVHKSQGSTFTNVLMDDVDISRASFNSNSIMEDIDMGDAKPIDYNNVDIKDTEDIDLGDLGNTDTTSNEPNQAANVKQQLEYVGVSRATDTVTIISNNVKKEGSPLHIDKNIKDNTINSNNSRSENSKLKENGTEEYKATDEFRRVQEASRKLSQEQISRMRERLSEDDKRRLGGLLGRQLDTARNGGRYNIRTSLTYTKKNGKVSTFNIGDVDPQLFHDIFEIVRTYLKNGELVDLHEDYSDAKCFITSDGLAGFAIEPDGNLVSVFSLNPKENGGFLYAIKDMVREEGATHLDAYASDKQPLQEIYSKTLGFHTAATMDYNMEYDHDDIAKNHGNPQVVFMVDHEVAEPKHFDKDSYDSAQQYQLQQLRESETEVINPSFPEGQTQKVSLPGYEYFNELYDETPVDAAWKIPYLKELDAQLSMDKSSEINDNIINQMDTVLQATSEKEYLQESKDSKKNKVKETLDEYDKLNQQIDNLLGGNEDLEELDASISASEIRHTAELIANEISDLITRLNTEKGLVDELFPTVNSDKDFLSASRKEIVEAVDINRLIDRVKTLFSSEVARYEDMDTSVQADLITDNWDAMMYLAADVFAMNEGFGITKDYSNGHFTTIADTKIDYDNFNDYSNDPDIAAETGEKDEQEHWQIESKTIDVLNSMSALVRQGLHECYLLNEDGSKVMSKWGIAERVNPRKTVNSILRWTQGALSLKEMVKRLSDKQKQNPWLSQLITRLSDESGKETDFQSQFYGVFSKHFQPYSIVLLEDGKYHSMIVNSHPALKEAAQTITSQFKIGEHPLFRGNIVNAKLLGNENTIGKNSDFNLHKALSELQNIDKALKQGNTLDDTMSKTATDNIVATCRVLGYNITEDVLTDSINAENISTITKSLGFIVRDLDKALQEQRKGELKNYDPFKFGGEYSIDGSLKNFLTPITEKLEDTAISAFYDSGKMYQSYITPSFMTKLMNKFRQEGQEFEDFILDNYGSSEWFKFNAGDGDISRGWRNDWLRLLATDANARKIFDHKVELNFNKHNYMRNMSDAEYTLSLITEYYAESTKRKDQTPSWYRIPMQSNKPSSEFIKFYSYRGASYKNSIANRMLDMFLQELSRIQTVRMRNYSKNDPQFIKNFDTNGRKFNFLPVFNAYLENTAKDIAKRDILRNEDNTISDDNARFAALLQKKITGEEALTENEEALFGNLAKRIITQNMENRVQTILNTWENNGILEAAKSIKDIYPSELSNEDATSWVREQVENFLWNDNLASKNILQLAITDIAFYKDTEDLQKRLAQLHAPGVRGNIYATDYNGNRVSDGKYRTFVLQDFDSFKSNIIANIREVFDRRIATAPDNQKAQLLALQESLVGKDGKYTKINVTDAQGYSSPSSYRKKALIFGRWSKQAEDIYQKLQKGDYNYTDLETAFQPLKPFVYTKLTKDMGVDNAPIHSMQVPFQAKNAEYLLIMADAILKGEELSRPNLLRAVYRVMEDSEKYCPTKGIDTVQFESAIKSGLQGKMNIFQYRDMPGGEEAAYTYMMNQIFKEDTDATSNRIYKNYNTDTFVHEASYEDYCLQQEVPEHFKEHSQAHGSQIRMITPSDLDLYTTDENGNQVDNYYEWTESDGTHKKVKANEFRKEYEKTIAENIEESITNLEAELHLKSENKAERNIALSKILQREILSSPRYGIDLVQACSIDKKTGEFRIPKGDPIQAKRIEQLINSVIKNRINKQKISGGPIVQVSNFGTSKQLHIRFNDREGNLLPLEAEYNLSEHNNMSYKDYLKKNQGGIAYFEVFCPIWSNELFEKFANADSTINVEAINNTDPELLKMVSYRIPTEDKYSCAPMKVVGFMPREAGDAIMLPYELTEIDDSDFDVDKRYVMRKDIPIKTKKRSEIEKQLFDIASESYKKAHDGKTNNAKIGEEIRMFLDNPQKMKNTSKFQAWLYKQYQHIAYYTDAPVSGKQYRDNKIVDMTYAVLTNQMTADKILNPGGFDAPKKMGYMVAAYKNHANKGISWNDLNSKSIEELKKLSYADKDLTFADTQVQFYKQNSAAASLIGVFAVNKVAHATLESNDIFLDVSEICGENPFTIAGTTFGGRMQIDMKYDREGTLIGKTLGSLVSASADAVKDPILNLMNVNMTTAGMLNTMLRLGMTFNDAALFLSQNIIERTLNQFNRENLTNYSSLNSIIEGWLNKYREKYNITDTSNINTEELTTEELVEGLTSEEHEATDYKVLLAFQKMRQLTEAMRKPTYATRFNSISSAVGPLIVDNLIIEHKMESFLDANTENGTHFYTEDNVPVDIDDIFFDHPILKQFARTVDVAKNLFSDMPTGSAGFRNLLANLPTDISNKMYNDKKLLDQFSNFYQSYLLMQSGVMDAKDLKFYATEFPKWFTEQNFKEKYPNNELIQAIRMNVAKRTGKPYLTINITGMDEQRKEELRSAWIDLHKDNPELSQMLFNYSFFRAGIGFSPKTFMSLVPTFVKEKLKSKDGNASYIDTYRNFPTVVPDLVIDQFIRNNWDNNKLVPIKGGKDTHYNIDTKHGVLTVYRPEEVAELADITYIKTKAHNQTYLWKFKSDANNQLTFDLVKPLGNNGEYLEISTSEIVNSLSETTETHNEETDTTIQESASDLKTVSSQESTVEETSDNQVITNTEKVKNLAAFADLVMDYVPNISKDTALQRSENIKNHERMFGKFLQGVFKKQGLDLSIDEAINEFKKYC